VSSRAAAIKDGASSDWRGSVPDLRTASAGLLARVKDASRR